MMKGVEERKREREKECLRERKRIENVREKGEKEQNGLAVPRNNSNAPMRETTFIEIISALLNYFIQQYLNKQIRENKNWVYVQIIYTYTTDKQAYTDTPNLNTRIPERLHTRCLLYKKVVTTLQQKVDWEIKTEKALTHPGPFFLKNREKEIIYNSFVTYYTYVCE